MRLLLLCSLMLLCGCGSPSFQGSETLFETQPWPAARNLEKQSGVAKYITKAKRSYDSCKVNLEEIEKIVTKTD